MTDAVLVKVDEHGVAEVCLNRPEKKNAWNLAVFDGLTEAAETLANRDGLRAVILHGAGGVFSSGLDLSMLMEFGADIEGLRRSILTPGPRGANRYQRPCTAWRDLSVPVIAAVDGVAFGAGMQLALAADFRIAAPDARFSIMEAKWGLIPDMGISQFLPGLMRADQAKELIMSARVLSATEAVSLGLVTRLDAAPLDAARALAADLSDRSPDALAGAKQLVDRVWALPPGEGLAIEAELQAAIIGAPNQIEAVAAAVARRKPAFR
ncbi:MAG: crotonase/enoyl-CoA hydratase family protein [Paracoccaceae bacterium]